MEVPLNDGTGRYLSVEDLKAGYLAGEAGSLDAEKHAFARDKALHEQERIEHENKILRSSRELQDVMALVTDLVPSDRLAAYQKAASDRAVVEAQRLVEAMPQFRDPTVYAGWMKDATGLLGSYGFTQAEANNIADHRIYKMLDDFKRLRARVKELEAIPDDIPRPPRAKTRRGAPSRSGVSAAVERAKQTGAKADQVTAARMLIERGAKR